MTPKEKATLDIDHQACCEVKSTIQKRDRALEVANLIPEEISYEYRYGNFYLESDDTALFTTIGNCLNAPVKKDINTYNRTGYLSICKGGLAVFSKNIVLPKTCTFKKVTKTIETYEPTGNCGPWFTNDK